MGNIYKLYDKRQTISLVLVTAGLIGLLVVVLVLAWAVWDINTRLTILEAMR